MMSLIPYLVGKSSDMWAIAGVLHFTSILILDEATSMLDPQGRT